MSINGNWERSYVYFSPHFKTVLTIFHYCLDFVIANDGEPVVLIEAKVKDMEPTKALRKFQDFLKTPSVQLVEDADGYRLFANGDQSIPVAPACQWLSTLP
jgi:hypothetical protein